MNVASVPALKNSFTERVQIGYRLANLADLLRQLRQPERYIGANGDMGLSAGQLGVFNAAQAEQGLRDASAARRVNNSGFRLAFDHPQGGLSHGLNPYTDWSMSLLARPPSHTYLFLGLDFYSVADLAHPAGWDAYVQNPFLGPDRYWHALWAWILNATRTAPGKAPTWNTPIAPSEAEAFMRYDGGAFIFHNLIPYLRPPDLGSTGKIWPGEELAKPAVVKSIIEDLHLLRSLSAGPMIAHCTSAKAMSMLAQSGFLPSEIVCWNAHPSKFFHPSTLYSRDIYFKPVSAIEPGFGVS